MNNKLGFAVLGCGRMGLRRIGLIRNHPQAELCCIEDCDEEIARKVSQETGCDYYCGWQELLLRTDIDCVMVSVPNKFHHDTVIAALESGKHVFCEKPLARNPAEAQEMVQAAKKTGHSIKVGSNLRYFPSVLKAKELLDNGAIGELFFARGWIGHSGWQVGTWYSDPDIIGGGTLLDNGCHLLDICLWWLGEVESCMGWVSTLMWPVAPLEDNAMTLLKFTNGRTAFIQSSWTDWAGYMYLELYGAQGSLRIDNRGQSCITTMIGRDGRSSVFDFSKEPARSYVLEFDEYVQAILNHRQALPSGYDGLGVIQVIDGVYRSALAGREVKIEKCTEVPQQQLPPITVTSQRTSHNYQEEGR